MKTLQDLIAASTPGPLYVHHCSSAAHGGNTLLIKRHKGSLGDGVAGIHWMNDQLDAQDHANALRLAHSYNVLPEVVDILESLLARNGGPISGDDTVDGQEYVMVRMDDFKRAEIILSKANTIP